jgi:hypothetical protein
MYIVLVQVLDVSRYEAYHYHSYLLIEYKHFLVNNRKHHYYSIVAGKP